VLLSRSSRPTAPSAFPGSPFQVIQRLSFHLNIMPKRKRDTGSSTPGSMYGLEINCSTTINRRPIASQNVQYGRVDPTFGQRSAIPGLEEGEGYDGDGDVEYEGADVMGNALAYLRSVREEANTIPTVLSAPRTTTTTDEDENNDEPDRSIYTDGIGDSRGYYSDGAYTASASLPVNISTTTTPPTPQEAYTTSLLARFRAIRKRLYTTPPRCAVEALSPDQGTYYNTNAQGGRSGAAKREYQTWQWRLRNTAPQSAQLASMPKETVLRLLRMLSRNGMILGPGEGEGGMEGRRMQKRLGQWVWGLLARLPDSGELGSEEVGVVRELGKRAVWLGMESRGLDLEALREETGEGDSEAVEAEVVDVEVEDEHEDSVGKEKVDREIDYTEARGDDDFDWDDEADGIPPTFDVQVTGVPPSAIEASRSQLQTDEVRDEPSAQYNDAATSEANTKKRRIAQDPNKEGRRCTVTEVTPPPDGGRAFEIRDAETGQLIHPGMDRAEPGEEEEDLSAARERLLSRLNADKEDEGDDEGEVPEDAKDAGLDGTEAVVEDPEVSAEERATGFRVMLDMIITVAGEMYGQRDLLEFREVWT
jgi:hypothetical protein